MHHVKLSAMPCFLIDTGCRCRKKFVSITTMRLRRSTGAGCRKMLFQICDSRMISPSVAIGCGSQGSGVRELDSYVRRSVLPLAHFLLKRAALVDEELTVVGQADRVALERAGRGAFEIDPVLVKAAAVAGAFEFLLRFE